MKMRPLCARSSLFSTALMLHLFVISSVEASGFHTGVNININQRVEDVLPVSRWKYRRGGLTHDSGVNFDLNAGVLGLAQQQHLLAQNALLLGHVLARHLQTAWQRARVTAQLRFLITIS